MIQVVRLNDDPCSTNINEYLIDSVGDVASLPTSKRKGSNGMPTCFASSLAYVPDLSHIWMLGNDDVWHEV